MLVSFKDPVQTVAWVFKRRDVWLFKSGGELDDGLKFPDSEHRLLKTEDFNKLIATNKGRNEIVLILPTKIYREDHESLPLPSWVKSGGENGYVIMKY